MTRSVFRRCFPRSVTLIGTNFSGVPGFRAIPDHERQQKLLADLEAQLTADVYHQGLDRRGQRATPPALTGDEMDEAGW
jgi:hypothetical protein